MGAQLPRGFHARAFFGLALPMIVSRTGLAAMGMADGVMVSRFQAHEFAWLSLAEGTLGRLLDLFVAFVIGGLAVVARHHARGDAAGARQFWMRTLPAALSLGVVGLLVGLCGQPLLSLMGQSHELAAGAAPVMAILGAGYPASLLAISAAVYLEAINRPQFVAICVVSANVLNVGLNWLLIGGHAGFGAMGARGSALSTTIVRCALCLALVGYAWRLRAIQTEKDYEALRAERAASARAQWRMGFGAAGTVAVMVALTAPLTLFAGRLGVLPLATFSAAWSLAAPAALLALGMADAAGIYVGAEAGRSGERCAAAVAWASLRATLVPTAALVGILAIRAHFFASLFSKDLLLQTAMTAVVPVVAAIVLIDCGGFVMGASLRALREVAWPTGIDIGSMLLLVPLALTLAFAAGYGVLGLFLAMLSVAVVRLAMLMWRFWWRTRNTVLTSSARMEEWSLNAE
jgi:MATE family multidrug resistance protein